MLSAEEMRIKSLNETSASIEKLESKNLQIEAHIMDAITPYIYAERLLQREVEVLHHQEKMLEACVNDSKPIDFTAVNHTYQRQLDELQKDFIEGYETLLKARTQIFAEGRFMPLTKDNRAQKLREFSESPEFCEQMERFKAFSILPSDNLPEKYQKIKNQKAVKLAQLEELVDAKTAPSQQLLNVEDDLNVNKHLLKVKHKESINKLDQSFAAMCQRGEIENVKQYLTQTIKNNKRAELVNQVGEDGLTAFHYACLNPKIELIRLLLEEGAQVLLKSEEGYYPVHYVVRNKIMDTSAILELLQKFSSKMNLASLAGRHGRTPLHMAANSGNYDAVAWLVTHGAPIDAKEHADNKCNEATPLHNAAFNGHANIVKYLLISGANPTPLNRHKQTPLQECIHRGFLPVAYAFYERGIWLSLSQRKYFIPLAQKDEKIKACLETPVEDYKKLIQHSKEECSDSYLQRTQKQSSASGFFKNNELTNVSCSPDLERVIISSDEDNTNQPQAVCTPPG